MDEFIMERLNKLGINERIFDQYAHQRELQRRRQKYAEQPEKNLLQRERRYAAFLRRRGYAVIDIKQMPDPGEDGDGWDDKPLNDFVNCAEDMYREWKSAQREGENE